MTESNHSASSKLVRDVVALGRKYSKTAFPNPNREGCPNRSTLRAMAYRDRRLTLEDLPVSHVVSCSPCFQEYLHFRRMSVLLRGIQITAASLVVLAVAIRSGAICMESHWPERRTEHFAEAASRAAASCRDPASHHPSCSACDECRFGFLLPNSRRGRQGTPEIRYISRRNCSGSTFFCPLVWNPENTHFD